jgi:hypothetical protein
MTTWLKNKGGFSGKISGYGQLSSKGAGGARAAAI